MKRLFSKNLFELSKKGNHVYGKTVNIDLKKSPWPMKEKTLEDEKKLPEDHFKIEQRGQNV